MRSFILSVIAVAVLVNLPSARGEEIPYYGFYPSKQGANIKTLRHNILNFEIDIPSDWNFGVHGSGALLVAILFQEGFDTSVLSDDYRAIEVGNLGSEYGNLQRTYETTWLGIQEAHGKKILKYEDPISENIGGHEAISFIYTWRSRDGYEITEKLYFIKASMDIRSVAIRVGKNQKQNLTAYERIVSTFDPI